ncbi:MAG: DUF4301 family protein [Acidobacteria bacterium]|nr:DUF4301 family protein [Acidobacteriota bacterium]
MSEPPLFSDRDLDQMARLGITPERALRHVELFRNPPPYTRVLRPCTLGDGIRAIFPDDEPGLTARFDAAAAAGRIHKLVPASGAASRMFQPLLERLDQLVAAAGHAGEGEEDGAAAGGAAAGAPAPALSAEARTFFAELPRFAFFEDLAAAAAARGVPLAAGGGTLTPAEQRTVLACLLTAAGLGYSETPKGLILFHRYPQGPRTPFEEHLVEAARYARDRGGVCRLHFTVSPQHEAGFRDLLADRGAALGRRLGCRFEVGFSHQRRSTDTLAVDPEHRPFRLPDGSLLFRPGGHGALLDNLQQLAGEGAGIVLLKNIDNVVPDRLEPELTRWKKLLGGTLAAYRERACRLLDGLDAALPDEDLLDEAARFAEHELSRQLPARFAAASAAERRHLLFAALDRPMRVAGVVRNTGEPGGGPFWVEAAGGEVSLQIVETSQIGPEPDQQAALAASTHFNPVDMACALHDRAGRPYDLDRFVDPATVFIAAKSHEGQPLKALEHPGLWNGAMAGWNTVFVEVPNATFAPVKTVLDLLRPEHQGG